MEVFDNKQHGSTPRQGDHHGDQNIHRTLTGALGGQGGRGPYLRIDRNRQDRCEQRQSLRRVDPELRQAICQARHPLVRRRSLEANPRADQLDNRMQRRVRSDGRTTGKQQVGAVARDFVPDQFDEPRLADARFAAQQQELGGVGRCPRPEFADPVALTGPANVRSSARRQGGRLALPRDNPEQFDRPLDSFERPQADRLQSERLGKSPAERACDDHFAGRRLGLDARGNVGGLADGQTAGASEGPDHHASAVNPDTHSEIDLGRFGE